MTLPFWRGLLLVALLVLAWMLLEGLGARVDAGESVRAHTRRVGRVSAICATRPWHRYGDRAMDQPPQVVNAVVSPTRAVTLILRVFRPIMLGVGIAAVLEVPGRRTGAPRKVTLIPWKVEGSTYLLSRYGATDWVRNLRAAGRGELRRKGRTQAVTAIEVGGAERDRVIAAFRGRSNKLLNLDFDQLPDAADHPAFKLEPMK